MAADWVLYEPSGDALAVSAPTLILKRKGEKLLSCSLQLTVNFDLYQAIESRSLFNLKSDLKGKLRGGVIQPEGDIIVQAVLHPVLVSQMGSYIHDIQGAADYLQTLSRQEKEAPLVSTEAWFVTSVQQQQPKITASYQTFWHCVDLGAAQEGLNTKTFLNGIMKFLQEKTDVDLSDISAEMDQILELSNLLAGDVSTDDPATLEKLLETVTTNISPAQPLEAALADLSEETYEDYVTGISQAVHDFFAQGNWEIYASDEPNHLKVKAKGQHGEWTCLAEIDDLQEQFIFYSIYPIYVPQSQQRAVAELLIRANLGMIIGNFEINFDTGEIRYKTSIDVQGSYLDEAIISNLVSANLWTMDEYFPTIMAAIHANAVTAES